MKKKKGCSWMLTPLLSPFVAEAGCGMIITQRAFSLIIPCFLSEEPRPPHLITAYLIEYGED
jgi:hypothetical protein